MKRKLKLFIIILVTIVVVLLAFSLPFNSDKEKGSSGSSPKTSKGNVEKETFVFSPFSRNKITEQEVSDEVVEETSLDRIYPDLPIYIENHETSVDLTTSISIYRTVMDPWDEIRLEIYGIEYKRAAIDIHDPNMIAFQETFLMAKDILSVKGINLSELNINYGNVPYVSDVAEFWVENLHLL